MHKVILYELLNHSPVTGFVAVFAATDGEEPPRYSMPVLGLGVAKVTERIFASEEVGSSYHDKSHPNEVVSTVLEAEGDITICEETHNFCGICREGDDILQPNCHTREEYRLKGKYAKSSSEAGPG